MKGIVNTLILICLVINLVSGQQEMFSKQKNEFLNDLVASFENEFLWEKKGLEIAKALNAKIKNGDYAEINKPEIFVEILNRDLYLLSQDLHLKVDLYQEKGETKTTVKAQEKASFIQKKLVDDGIYYLKFDEFPSLNLDVKKEIENTFSNMGTPKSIIIDLRNNSGGADETVNYIVGYFFEEEKMLATSYRWNEAAVEIWTKPKAQSPQLSQSALILLTSASTFSAAEVFTQRLQLHDRAIVIGEKTAGAAHRTMTYLMSDIFLLYWPYEKSLHANGQKDLEGVGIFPDYPAHYSDAKKLARKYAVKGEIKKNTPLKNPKPTKLIRHLEIALNAKADGFSNFMEQYVLQKDRIQVENTLNKFRTVWNDALNAKITNIHYIAEDQIRIFLNTTYGAYQMKIILNQDKKIEKIMMR